MFTVSTNIKKKITKKKKLLFISTMSSNKATSFEPKIFDSQQTQYKITSKSSSLNEPIVSPKKPKNFFGNTNNNHINHKIFPMKRIMFRLYKVNFLNSKKGRDKTKTKNKNEINYRKNGNFNLKHKQKNIIPKNNNTITFNNKNYSAGRWKSDEHQRFIDAIIKYGNNWRQVQKYVGTRSSTQTRSHAQKFFEKLKRSKLFKKEKYDFSKNSLTILHDIMHNLPKKEYEQTLKALHTLSYEKSSSFENEKNVLQNNINNLNNNGNENNMEKNCDGNNINDENIKCIKFFDQGYCFLESNNNKLYNYDDYLFYNNSNCNIYNNMNCNNYLINDNFNYDIKTFGRKESDIYSQRKNSLSDMNVKDLKEQNNNIDEYNCEYNLNSNLINNNINLNIQQENKNIINKNFDNIEDKLGYKSQLYSIDYLFNQQNSRKVSLGEKIIY